MRRVLFLFGALAVSCPAAADTFVKPGAIFAPRGTLSLTLTAGGVAQTLVAAIGLNTAQSCMFANPVSATDQGIGAAEVAYINMVGTAVAGGGGATFTLNPGDVLKTGPQNGAISWIAATTGHQLQGVCWQ